MKKSLKTLVAIATFGAMALAAQAQPAVKLLVVDMAKLYDNHYKTQEQNAKIQADDQKATEEVDRMNKEGNALVEEYKSLSEKSNNPALTAEAKTKAQADAQKKFEEIQRKQQEIQQFIGQTRQSLQQRFNTFKNLMLEEISKTASEIAKRKGATLLIDRSGPSVFGVSNILYTDPAYDITEEVLKELNKDRPAGTPAASTGTTTPSTATPGAASTSTSTGGITVPGLKK